METLILNAHLFLQLLLVTSLWFCINHKNWSQS